MGARPDDSAPPVAEPAAEEAADSREAVALLSSELRLDRALPAAEVALAAAEEAEELRSMLARVGEWSLL